MFRHAPSGRDFEAGPPVGRRLAMALIWGPILALIVFAAWALPPDEPDPDFVPREIRTHTIVQNDSYWKIARMYYPDHDPRYIVDLLREWNPWYRLEALPIGKPLYLPEVRGR